MIRTLLLASILVPAASALAAGPPELLELKDGDRIVYLGNGFVERDANYGYFETLLTIAHPDISFTFRNLGWSGDTVWGDARARFGTRADGFKHLKDHVFALKPTVILVAYGMNESFAGEAGLPEFEKGLNTLLDTLAETKARIVLISPLLQEELDPPLPDPTKHNIDIKEYRDAIGRIAFSRTMQFVDLIKLAEVANANHLITSLWTDDGLHPTDKGYSALVKLLCVSRELVETPPFRKLVLTEDGKKQRFEGWRESKWRGQDGRIAFEAVGSSLLTRGGKQRVGGLTEIDAPTLFILGVRDGKYTAKIDGVVVGHFWTIGKAFHDRPAGDGKDYIGEALCVRPVRGPEIDQVEELRAAINKKNELYFHRWRPQNETYLFLFRKHEQGNNAAEIPLFDPLVAEQEAEIARLKKPVPHTYELIREGDGK